MQRLGLVSCLTRLHPLRTEWAQGIADRCGLFTGAYAAESLALPYCFLRNSPGGTDMCSLSQCASERCLWLCKLSQGVHRVLAVQPWWCVPGCGDAAWMWICLDVGSQLWHMLLGSRHTRQGQGFVLLQPCTVALPLQHWLIALSLSVSSLVLFSQTCHLVLPGAGTPVGHFFSPFSSELILASPLIFFHCLSPLSPPQLSPPGAASCSSDCMSSGTASLTAVMLAGSHPRPSPPAQSHAPSLAGTALHAPGQAPAHGCPFCAKGPSCTLCLGCGWHSLAARGAEQVHC